jgi:hypothetical protein
MLPDHLPSGNQKRFWRGSVKKVKESLFGLLPIQANSPIRFVNPWEIT